MDGILFSIFTLSYILQCRLYPGFFESLGNLCFYLTSVRVLRGLMQSDIFLVKKHQVATAVINLPFTLARLLAMRRQRHVIQFLTIE